jgi:20S proteasome subunit beta 3
MKEEREITPKTFTHLVSSTLYEKRYVAASLYWKPLRASLIGTLLMWTSFGPFFIEPVIAGLPPKTELDPNPKPFISCMDT